MTEKLRPIAFVLPQFHPIPENDEWWGKGFTEWTNVTKAKPLFEGHYQPHLPADLGFYDLRLPKARAEQAKLAKDYGIYGFCYYHYWFNGKRLLNEPIDGMLNQEDLDMPFMFCWANENWTRRWDGREKEILIEQQYSNKDDIEHIRWLCKNIFSDERYIRIDDKPVFMIYRHNLFPDFRETVKIWRDIASNEFGYKDLYLCITESLNDQTNPDTVGVDASVEFSPHIIISDHQQGVNQYKPWEKFLKFKKKKIKKKYRQFKNGVEWALNREIPNYKLFRCVTPSWDNTARRGDNGIIVHGSSPGLYQYWLHNTALTFKPFSEEENFIFINAMNEWAEGNHLEPCIKYGKAYLEATKKALEDI